MMAAAGWLIVAVVAAAPIPARYPGAVTIYECDFEESSDVDFDGWPQGWNRRRGPAYPHYLKLTLSHESSPRGQSCFRFDLDGGAAAVSSPPAACDAGAEYLAEVFVKTVDLKHDEAFVALRFLNEQGVVVHSEYGPRLQTTEWRKVTIGPVHCDHAEARSVVVELHLAPGDGRDLHGAALFDDVWLGKLPRKSIRGSKPFNVFPLNEPVELGVTLSGLSLPQVRAKLELFDRDGHAVFTDERTSAPLPSNTPAGSALSVDWQPKLTAPGFYHGRVTVYGDDCVLREDETSLAIVEPIERYHDVGSFTGDFGWSITDAGDVPQLDKLYVLLHDAVVRRLKYPVWFAKQDSAESQRLQRLVEQLNVQGVAVVGTLTPQPLAATGETHDDIAAVQTFRETREKWLPLVEPTMFDLAFKVRGWQLGTDRDLGFLALPAAASRIADVKKEFDRIEQDAQVGVAWSWLQEPPHADRPAMRFLSLSATPELTADELSELLDATAKIEGVQRWISLSALPQAIYAPDDRVRDLVERLVAAKGHGADAIFFVDPFSAHTGLMERGGAPTDLFLPWRTITATLDGAIPAGSLTLPGGSRNRLFLRSSDAVLIVSAETPTRETLTLEGNPRVVDLWGRTIETQETPDGVAFDVGPMPLAVTGLDRGCAVWDQSLRFERPQLREAFDVPQTANLLLKNTFDQPVQGKVTIIAPDDWTVRPKSFDLSLSVGESVKLPMEITLPSAVETGSALIRIDHDVAADRRRQFSEFRELRIGGGDLLLQVTTRYVGDTLEVEQRLVNNSTGSISFRCNLFAPNQRRLRTQINNLPPGVDVQTYRIPDARELDGRMLWIRAEEIDGNRVLSRRFVVGEDPT